MNDASNFNNFWPEYVRAHSQPGTRALHLTGTLAGWVLLAAAILLQRWWWIAGALFLPYALAWVSHFFVEHKPPRLVSASPVVLVGRPANGCPDARRKNEPGSSPLYT